jgi:hypothetical protein
LHAGGIPPPSIQGTPTLVGGRDPRLPSPCRGHASLPRARAAPTPLSRPHRAFAFPPSLPPSLPPSHLLEDQGYQGPEEGGVDQRPHREVEEASQGGRPAEEEHQVPGVWGKGGRGGGREGGRGEGMRGRHRRGSMDPRWTPTPRPPYSQYKSKAGTARVCPINSASFAPKISRSDVRRWSGLSTGGDEGGAEGGREGGREVSLLVPGRVRAVCGGSAG